MDSIPFAIDGYELRCSSEEDRPYILSCIKDSILASVTEEEATMEALWINDILGITSATMDTGSMENESFILRRDGTRVGMLWMGKTKDQFTCDDIGYLLGIFVKKELRGRGLGRGLLESAESWCRARGLISMSINVGSCNRRALELYESSGYEIQTMVMKRPLL